MMDVKVCSGGDPMHRSSPPKLPNSLRMEGVQKRRAGRKKFQETRHPIFKGVRRRNGKWVCELRQPGNSKCRIWLGTFTCPEMAARAHDAAALALKGDSAHLNFPESAHLLPHASSTSIRDVRSAALEAADLLGTGSSSRAYSDPSTNCSYSSSLDEGEGKFGIGDEGSKRVVFLDEEELFNMPVLIDSMAEGLILTPPAMQRGFSWDDVDDAVDLTLWSD